MIALIDGDIVAYRCAASAEKEEAWIAKARTSDLLDQILVETKATEFRVFLSGDNNFRLKIYPAYKANRTAPKPVHLIECKKLLTDKFGAVVTDGYEADDALGIHQEYGYSVEDAALGRDRYSTIICSIDKDLLQIPGLHYNFVKKEMREVSEYEGLLSFYTSLLVGDATDNIKGCPGIGKARAPRILSGCETEQEMFNACRDTYNDDESMLLNGHLLYIWKKEADNWNPERFIKQEAEATSESTLLTQEGNTPSTVLGGTT